MTRCTVRKPRRSRRRCWEEANSASILIARPVTAGSGWQRHNRAAQLSASATVLYSDVLRNAPSQHFYDVITNGYGAMFSYADRVERAGRCAIVALYPHFGGQRQRRQCATGPTE